jgi:hypothetical protein
MYRELIASTWWRQTTNLSAVFLGGLFSKRERSGSGFDPFQLHPPHGFLAAKLFLCVKDFQPGQPPFRHGETAWCDVSQSVLGKTDSFHFSLGGVPHIPIPMQIRPYLKTRRRSKKGSRLR